MAFFNQARDFEINNANFYDHSNTNHGTQNNYNNSAHIQTEKIGTIGQIGNNHYEGGQHNNNYGSTKNFNGDYKHDEGVKNIVNGQVTGGHIHAQKGDYTNQPGAAAPGARSSTSQPAGVPHGVDPREWAEFQQFRASKQLLSPEPQARPQLPTPPPSNANFSANPPTPSAHRTAPEQSAPGSNSTVLPQELPSGHSVNRVGSASPAQPPADPRIQIKYSILKISQWY
ncbi:hypothetical protein NP233_g1871 [Leucocoprinus birnbaumii]|uniref:Uncharacterized protein n=1 Tax=Leucocoprinus birnbaumii TaxID=56174 RepID=A0AAD5W1S8_9AGAR|nr:hypothetical protein NP233_g1871 [Leucocoprinus birnbaumii]